VGGGGGGGGTCVIISTQLPQVRPSMRNQLVAALAGQIRPNALHPHERSMLQEHGPLHPQPPDMAAVADDSVRDLDGDSHKTDGISHETSVF
jgi:hypothetical protein